MSSHVEGREYSVNLLVRDQTATLLLQLLTHSDKVWEGKGPKDGIPPINLSWLRWHFRRSWAHLSPAMELLQGGNARLPLQLLRHTTDAQGSYRTVNRG